MRVALKLLVSIVVGLLLVVAGYQFGLPKNPLPDELRLGIFSGKCVAVAKPSEKQAKVIEALLGAEPLPSWLVAVSRSAVFVDSARRKAEDQHKWDFANLCKYHAANVEKVASGDTVGVVFIGDSITELWGAAQPALFKSGVVNRGISGQTSAQVLLRFTADAVALRPQIIHLMIGTNDIAGNSGLSSPELFKNNIRAMTGIAKAHHIELWLGSIPPATSFYWSPDISPAAYINSLNVWLQNFAGEHDFKYIDYNSALRGPDGNYLPGLSQDGVHPSRAGYEAMMRVLEFNLDTSSTTSG